MKQWKAQSGAVFLNLLTPGEPLGLFLVLREPLLNYLIRSQWENALHIGSQWVDYPNYSGGQDAPLTDSQTDPWYQAAGSEKVVLASEQLRHHKMGGQSVTAQLTPSNF